MSTRIGDRITILSQGFPRPVRSGEIREISDDPNGVVYLVWWSDTCQESRLRPGPGVVVKHRSGGGSGAVAAWVTAQRSRLRHLLEWRHRRHLERRQYARDEYLARRVGDILAGVGLSHSDFSIGGGRVVHLPEVVSVAAGPPVGVDIRILPGQTPDDFAAHAPAIAYNLGVAEVRIVPLQPDRIRLEMLPRDPQPRVLASRPVTTRR